MLWPHTGIIQPSRHGMGFDDLAVIVFHQVGTVTVQYTRTAGTQGRRMAAGFDTVTRSFHTIHGHTIIIEERMEQANGVRTAADTCHQRIRQLAGLLEALLAGFATDHALEVTHQ